MSEMAVEMGMYVLQQVVNRTRTLQLVREVLSMLEVEDAARVELHFNQDGIPAFRGVKDGVHGVHVQIEGPFAFAVPFALLLVYSRTLTPMRSPRFIGPKFSSRRRRRSPK